MVEVVSWVVWVRLGSMPARRSAWRRARAWAACWEGEGAVGREEGGFVRTIVEGGRALRKEKCWEKRGFVCGGDGENIWIWVEELEK